MDEAVRKKVKSYIERTGDTVAKAYEEGNLPAVEENLMIDVEATYNYFKKLKGYII